jgi:hypothetical protein
MADTPKIEDDQRFEGAAQEEVKAPNRTGVLQVEDKGDGVVIVRGNHGEIAVEYLGDPTEIPADLRTKITDLVVEYSAQAGFDPRHSEYDAGATPMGAVAPEVPQDQQVVVNTNLGADQGGNDSGSTPSGAQPGSATASAPSASGSSATSGTASSTNSSSNK